MKLKTIILIAVKIQGVKMYDCNSFESKSSQSNHENIVYSDDLPKTHQQLHFCFVVAASILQLKHCT